MFRSTPLYVSFVEICLYNNFGEKLITSPPILCVIAVMNISSECIPSKSVVASPNLSPTYQLVCTSVVNEVDPILTVAAISVHVGVLGKPCIFN